MLITFVQIALAGWHSVRPCKVPPFKLLLGLPLLRLLLFGLAIVSCVSLAGPLPPALALPQPPGQILDQIPGQVIGQILDQPAAQTAPASVYEQHRRHNPDGIGKFYLGREIAQVMGHQGAAWLERPSRSFEEQPNTAIAALKLQPTDVVADVGAGTGYFSLRISPLVPQGQVYAIDVQPEMIDLLTFLQQEAGLENITPILGSETDPRLPPNRVDLALMVDAYHEFAYPYEMMQGIVRSLKPGGRVALLEYRGENPLIPIKKLHKMTQRQVRREMQAVGLEWLETKGLLPQQHLMIFQKPGGEWGGEGVGK